MAKPRLIFRPPRAPRVVYFRGLRQIAALRCQTLRIPGAENCKLYKSNCMDTYRNFVEGEWVESSSQKTVGNVNPANTDDVLGIVRLSTREEARGAVEAAAEAFRGWRATPAPARGRIVARSARLIEENKEDARRAAHARGGQDARGSRAASCSAPINVAEFCAGESRRMNGETIPSELPSNFAYTLKQPHGVVAVVTPWNFPVAIPVWKIAPALVAGNTVVFKPATNTPATAVRIVETFAEAGHPRGRPQSHPRLGLGGGRRDRRATRPCAPSRSRARTASASSSTSRRRGAASSVQCEMGGKNPVVVLEDADMDARRRVHGAGRVRLDGPALHGDEPRRRRRVGRRRVRRAHRRARAGACASATAASPETEVGPIVDASQFKSVLSYMDVAREDGAELVCGGGAGRRRGLAQRLLRPADGLRPRHARHAHRARGGLRPRPLRPARQGLRRSLAGRQRQRVRALLVHLHATTRRASSASWTRSRPA